MTSNQIAYWNLQETKRSNLANENLKDTANAISSHQAQSARLNAETGVKAQEETMRHNRAQEALTQRGQNIQYQTAVLKSRTDTRNTLLKGLTGVLGVAVK